jgi:hypothetical protein
VPRRPDEPDIDPRWDEAIELLLVGASHKLVAERSGVHRNTVRNWLRDPGFRVKLAQRADDLYAKAKLRRALVTTQLVDRLFKVASEAMDLAGRRVADRDAQRAALEWCRIFRKLVAVEAEAAGPVVHRA